jgi:hypothetical protein
MNPYLKVFLGTVIPLGIFTGTALSASAGQVRIELLNVSCGNTEDITGADHFYIVGALSDGKLGLFRQISELFLMPMCRTESLFVVV